MLTQRTSVRRRTLIFQHSVCQKLSIMCIANEEANEDIGGTGGDVDDDGESED